MHRLVMKMILNNNYVYVFIFVGNSKYKLMCIILFRRYIVSCICICIYIIMNAQSNRPLTKFSGSDRGGALSVVLNKKPVMHVNCIQEKDMVEAQRMADEPVVLSTFSVDSTGFYNVSFQFALQNKSRDAKGLAVHFYDFGICKSDCTDSGDTLKNIPVCAKIVSENTLIDSLSSIVELDAECEYYAWVDVSSANNSMLEFIPSKSNVRLYAL